MPNKILKKDLPSGFDIEGHRGCRGLFPENSLPGFARALELGVTTLEMDLVISKDKQVVVSHEPYFSHEIFLSPDKKEIQSVNERDFNLFQMYYSEIKKFDTGSKIHPRFLNQKKIKTYKPLLNDVIELAENFSVDSNKPIYYNMEIKSSPESDNIFHPRPEEFSELVLGVLKEKNIIDQTIIQCFDLRPLQYLKKNYPFLKLSLLVENQLPAKFNLKLLGFTPDIYSPEYHLVDDSIIHYSKSLNFKVIPWTVNNSEEIKKLIKMGVHGVITDYPDIFE